MAIGTLATNISLFLGRTATVSTSDVLFFLGLGLYLLCFTRILLLLRTSTEGNTSTHYDGIYVVSTKHVHDLKRKALLNGKRESENGKLQMLAYLPLTRSLYVVSFPFSSFSLLMVEQAYTSECHGNAVLVASVDNMVVANTATCLCHILNTALVSTLDVVAEGEEGIAAQTNIGVLCQPLLHLLLGERFGALGEELLPFAVAQNVLALGANVDVDGIVAVGTTDTGNEGKVHHLGVLAKPPDVGLVACQAGAMDTALLTGADADGLTVLDIAYAIALGVLQGDEGDNQVATSLVGKVLVLCGDILKESGIGKIYLVASLLEGDAKALLALDGSGSVLGIYLDNIVCTLALCP